MIGALLCCVFCCGALDEDWSAVWEGLAELEALPVASGPERAAATLRLEDLAAAHKDPRRVAVLRFHLDRLAGGSPVAVPPPDRLDLRPGEAWPFARALDSSDLADEALVAAVGEVPEGPALARCLVLAYEHFQVLSDAFQPLRALRLAEALQRRARAPWSAGNLGRVLGRLGRGGEGRAILEEQLALESDPAVRLALRDDRGLLALGAGDWEAARRDLGHALANGSSSAADVLGQRALAQGRLDRARALFRGGAGRDSARPWALRGWGISMLAGADREPNTGPTLSVTNPSSSDR